MRVVSLGIHSFGDEDVFDLFFYVLIFKKKSPAIAQLVRGHCVVWMGM